MLTEACFTIESSTRFSLSNAIKICRDEKSELEKLGIMLEGQREKVSELENKLRSYDEAYLRDALTSVYDEEKMKSFDEKAAKRNYDFLSKSIDAMTEKLTETEKELAVLNATVKRPTEISEALISTEHELRELTEKSNAYMLAIEAIETPAESYARAFRRRLQSRQAKKWLPFRTENTKVSASTPISP